MTQSTRTIAQITASIDFAVSAINDMEANAAELRGARHLPCFVTGFEYGFFLTSMGTLGGVLHARKFETRAAAERGAVYNGKRELSRAYRHWEAINLALGLLEHALEALRECLIDCQLELSSAYEAEEMERRKVRYDYAERLRQAAIEGDWELHARIWEERRVADVEADEAALALELAADQGAWEDSFREGIRATYEAERVRKG
jgi:hypothetical protein